MRAGLGPPPILDRDPAHLDAAEAERFGVGALPASLDDALLALAEDDVVRGWLGPTLYEAYVGIKQLRAGRGRRVRPRRDVQALCRDLLTPRRPWAPRPDRLLPRLLGQLLASIERELPRAVELRHRLHEHPELAHAEEWTAATVAAELPVPCTTVAGTGRIARGDRPAPGWTGDSVPGGAPWQYAPSSTGCRSRSARCSSSAPRAARCTRAGTTCTWRRWWR